MRLRTRLALGGAAIAVALVVLFKIGDYIASLPWMTSANTYSEGCQQGMLTKFSPRGWVFSTGEGEMMMGRDSSVWTVRVGEQDVVRNPRAFSAPVEDVQTYRPLAGRNVVACYRQLYVWLHTMDGDTDYRLTSMNQIDASIPTPECRAGGGVAPTRSTGGFRTGLITKASERGRFVGSYEITVQEGSSGNRFHDMSITDKALYDCAMAYLRAGRTVTITYDDAPIRNPLARETSYRVTALRPAE